MSVPKRRKTSSRKRRGQSHHALKAVSLVSCPQCKKMTRPHHACQFCGFYKGKEVIKQGSDKPAKKKKKEA